MSLYIPKKVYPKKELFKKNELFADASGQAQKGMNAVRELPDSAFNEPFDCFVAKNMDDFYAEIYMRYMQYFAEYTDGIITSRQYHEYAIELNNIADLLASRIITRKTQFDIEINLSNETFRSI